MGSWNETCAMTGLPINYGDEVVLFLIEETIVEKKHRYAYSHDEWAPRGIQLYGKYEDYGRYSVVPSIISNLTLESFTKQLVEMDVGDNQVHDIAIKLENLSWELINEAVHESRLYVKKWSGLKLENSRVSRVAILKSVFDECVNIGFDSYMGSLVISGKDIPRSVAEYIEATKKELGKYDELTPEGSADKKTVKSLMQTRLEFEGPPLNDSNALYNLIGISGGSFFISWSIKAIMREAINFIANNELDKAEEILTEAAKFNIFYALFDGTRRRWTPTSGAGSQMCNYDLHLKLSNFLSGMITKIIKSEEDA